MRDDLIQNMRGRMEKCRRLAASILDEQASKALLKMASDIERDVRRLEAEREGHPNRASSPRPRKQD